MKVFIRTFQTDVKTDKVKEIYVLVKVYPWLKPWIKLNHNIYLYTTKSAIPQGQTYEYCRITCRPGSANYFKYKILMAD